MELDKHTAQPSPYEAGNAIARYSVRTDSNRRLNITLWLHEISMYFFLE
jgi:hypothetical protein